MFLHMGGSPWVVASSAEAADAFVRGKDKEWANRPSNMFVRLITNNLRNIARANYGSHWRHMHEADLHLAAAVHAEAAGIVPAPADGGDRPDGEDDV